MNTFYAVEHGPIKHTMVKTIYHGGKALKLNIVNGSGTIEAELSKGQVDAILKSANFSIYTSYNDFLQTLKTRLKTYKIGARKNV